MRYLDLLKTENLLPNELQKLSKGAFCSFCSSESRTFIKNNGYTNCFGYHCEHSCYSDQKGCPFLWCGKAEKAVFDMLVCPSGLWFKSPDNKRVFDTPEGQQQRLKGGCNGHHHLT